MNVAPPTAPDPIAAVLAAALVSVIIPTFNRPRLVLRAIASALAQTHRNLEIIVVIDGKDEATVRALGAIADPRLRVVQSADHVGAGRARDLAITEARGAWIATLDDDDEWLPEKLEAQLRCAATGEAMILSCLARIVTPLATYVWPRQVYDNRQPLDEYLFDRRSIFRGKTSMMTSTLVLPRCAVAALSFGAVPQHEEIGFLLRASKSLGLKIVTAPQVLAAVHTEETRPSLGTGFPWRGSLAWLDSMGPLITRRAYSGFCLTHLSAEAASARDCSAFPTLLALAFRRGAPTAMQLIVFFAFWLVPKGLRRRGRALFSRARQAA